jgi:hypothetical protein
LLLLLLLVAPPSVSLILSLGMYLKYLFFISSGTRV